MAYKSVHEKKVAVAKLVEQASTAELFKTYAAISTPQLNDLFESLAFSDALHALAEICDEWRSGNGQVDE